MPAASAVQELGNELESQPQPNRPSTLGGSLPGRAPQVELAEAAPAEVASVDDPLADDAAVVPPPAETVAPAPQASIEVPQLEVHPVAVAIDTAQLSPHGAPNDSAVRSNDHADPVFQSPPDPVAAPAPAVHAHAAHDAHDNDTAPFRESAAEATPEQGRLGSSDGSVPATALVAPAPRDPEPGEKCQPDASVPTLRAESGPNSPQTPREAAARGEHMLKVDSCQLNTGSTAPPLRDASVGNPGTSSGVPPLPSPSPAATPNGSTNASALPPGPAAQPPAPKGPGTSSAYATASTRAPLSSPAVTNGIPPKGVTGIPTQGVPRIGNGVINGVVNGSRSGIAMRSPRGAPANLQSPRSSAPSQLKSPRTTPRPITPPARSRGRQMGPSSATYGSEGLDELGSTFLKYPGVLPSFMRPTAAHEHRLNKADEELQAQRTPSPPRPATRSVNPNAHFIRPTASYQAKTSLDTTPITRAHSAAPVCICWGPRALCVSGLCVNDYRRWSIGCGVQATRSHTPTAFAPFCLHTEMRLPQRNRKTTDEMRVAEARKQKEEEAEQRRQQLQRLQKFERARTASPKMLDRRSAAPRSRGPKPFQLASVARHERELQARKEALQVLCLLSDGDAALCADLTTHVAEQD